MSRISMPVRGAAHVAFRRRALVRSRVNASNDQPDYKPDRNADNQNREWRRKYKCQFLEHVRFSHRNFHGASFHAFVDLAPCEEITRTIAPQCSLTLFPCRWNKNVDSAPIGAP